MCYLTAAVDAGQQAIPNSCPAKALPPSQRLQIGLQALAGTRSITALADAFDVSRKFVSHQSARAEQALAEAFVPPAADEPVLFHLPVTKPWLQQLILGLVLCCHSPLRGVVELLHELFDSDLSLGTVFNTLQQAVRPARARNEAQELRPVRVGGHDEIFQAGQPVLVGVDLCSTYCYLLSRESQRDADTWGVHLLQLQERGFAPDYVVADAGLALRAAQAEVMPQTDCRRDVFHTLQEVSEVVGKLENRAYQVMARCAELERKMARAQQQGRRVNRSWLRQRREAIPQQAQAIALADAVALLTRWRREDVLALAGPAHTDRQVLYDFLVAELRARQAPAPGLLDRLVPYLVGQREELLAFAAQLDRAFADLAAVWAVPVELIRELFAAQALPLDSAKRWRREAPVQRRLGARFFPLSQALQDVRRRVLRASSLAENFNSRLRSYFSLRRHLGNDYLALLQFYLNHRRYPRSERPERVGKSPAELLSGHSHPPWLELLGYQRFARN